MTLLKIRNEIVLHYEFEKACVLTGRQPNTMPVNSGCGVHRAVDNVMLNIVMILQLHIVWLEISCISL